MSAQVRLRNVSSSPLHEIWSRQWSEKDPTQHNLLCALPYLVAYIPNILDWSVLILALLLGQVLADGLSQFGQE